VNVPSLICEPLTIRYTGTLVVATHDRYLVNRLATKVIEVANAGIHVYDGTYADFLRAKASAATTPASLPAPAAARPRRPAAEVDPAARRRLAADLREAERAVTLAEERLRSVEAALSDPVGQDVSALSQEHAALLAEVERVVRQDMVAVEVVVPYGREDVLSALRELGGVDRVEYEEGGSRAWGWLPASALARFEPYRVSSA